MTIPRPWLGILLGSLAALVPLPGWARQDSRAIQVKPAAQAATLQEQRVALVIGNGRYHAEPLKNPVNDARAMADKLKRLGFAVVFRENLVQKQIGSTLREFRSRLAPGSVSLFYYAGHGLQLNGVNYLPSVDADIETEDDVPTQSLDLNKVLEIMEAQRTRLNLIFLDACRNNPFTLGFRSVGGGLARTTPPAGTILSFATRPGSVAADGAGEHGLYTQFLLQAMDEEGVVIEQALKKVLTGVRQASNGRQEPWLEGGIEGNFYFTPAAAPAPAAPGSLSPAMELAFWESIKQSRDPDDFKAYIQQYPAGQFLALAKNRLKPKVAESRSDPVPTSEAPPAAPNRVKVLVADLRPAAEPIPARSAAHPRAERRPSRGRPGVAGHDLRGGSRRQLQDGR